MANSSAKSVNRTVVLLLLAALLLPLFCTGAYCVATANHHCTGHICPVCTRIHALWAILASVEASHAPAALLWAGLPTALGRMHPPACKAAALSPVKLFVRLNN